jgi:hypothetical protein
MNIFYKLFYCFIVDYQSDSKTYHKIWDFIYTTNGEYIGTYNGPNSVEDVDTMAIHPDELLCCICLCCCPSCINPCLFPSSHPRHNSLEQSTHHP